MLHQTLLRFPRRYFLWLPHTCSIQICLERDSISSATEVITFLLFWTPASYLCRGLCLPCRMNNFYAHFSTTSFSGLDSTHWSLLTNCYPLLKAFGQKCWLYRVEKTQMPKYQNYIFTSGSYNKNRHWLPNEKRNLRFIKIAWQKFSWKMSKQSFSSELSISTSPFSLHLPSSLVCSWYHLWRRARTKPLQLFLQPFTGDCQKTKAAKPG